MKPRLREIGSCQNNVSLDAGRGGERVSEKAERPFFRGLEGPRTQMTSADREVIQHPGTRSKGDFSIEKTEFC